MKLDKKRISTLNPLSATFVSRPSFPQIASANLLDVRRDGGIFFGRPHSCKFDADRRFRYIGKSQDEGLHVLALGGSGTGKTQGVTIPTLAIFQGCRVLVDVKHELSTYYNLLRQNESRTVYHFSPGHVPVCHYNPTVHVISQTLYGPDIDIGAVRDLAFCLIAQTNHDPNQIWSDAARNFLTGALLYEFGLGKDFIPAIEHILIHDTTLLIDEVMQSSNAPARLFISKLNQVQDRVLSSIGLELSNLAPFVADRDISAALSGPRGEEQSFSWECLHSTEPVDVILSFPEAKLDRWAPLVHLILTQLIRSLEARPQRGTDNHSLPPVLILLDEFPRLGMIPALRSGLSTLRSRGVTFLLTAQSLAQFEDVYGTASARTMLDNIGYKLVLGSGDVLSQEYLSKLVGTRSALVGTAGVSSAGASDASACQLHIGEQQVPLIYPHEFVSLNDIVVVGPRGPFRVRKSIFEEDRTFFLHHGDYPSWFSNQFEERG